MEKLAQRLASLNQQFISDFKSLERRVDTIDRGQSPEDLRQKLESCKNDQNKKLKSMYEALEDMGNLQASIVETINGFKFEVERMKDAGSRPLSNHQGKENFSKYNTMRLDQTGLRGQGSSHNDRKHSFY
jgi:hypothetical protein